MSHSLVACTVLVSLSPASAQVPSDAPQAEEGCAHGSGCCVPSSLPPSEVAVFPTGPANMAAPQPKGETSQEVAQGDRLDEPARMHVCVRACV